MLDPNRQRWFFIGEQWHVPIRNSALMAATAHGLDSVELTRDWDEA